MKKLLLLLFISASILIAPVGALAADDPLLIASLQAEIVRLVKLINQLIVQRAVLAESYLVVDVATNETLLEKNTTKKYSIASITKLMNAVVTKENVAKEKTITLTKEMLTAYGQSPSLQAGFTVSRDELLKAMLIQSTNDAAEALSYFTGKEAFIRLMNEKASSLGMQNTTFVDTHGFDLQNQSTATDLVKLITYIQQNHPDLLEITKENDFWMPCENGKMCHFRNLNIFYQGQEFIGGKTGYLTEARESMVTLFTINGKTYAVIVLKSTNRNNDITKLANWLKTR